MQSRSFPCSKTRLQVCRGTERTGANISALSRDRSLSGAQEPIALTISSVWMQMTSRGCTSNAGRDDGDCIPFLRSPAPDRYSLILCFDAAYSAGFPRTCRGWIMREGNVIIQGASGTGYIYYKNSRLFIFIRRHFQGFLGKISFRNTRRHSSSQGMFPDRNKPPPKKMPCREIAIRYRDFLFEQYSSGVMICSGVLS